MFSGAWCLCFWYCCFAALMFMLFVCVVIGWVLGWLFGCLVVVLFAGCVGFVLYCDFMICCVGCFGLTLRVASVLRLVYLVVLFRLLGTSLFWCYVDLVCVLIWFCGWFVFWV